MPSRVVMVMMMIGERVRGSLLDSGSEAWAEAEAGPEAEAGSEAEA